MKFLADVALQHQGLAIDAFSHVVEIVSTAVADSHPFWIFESGYLGTHEVWMTLPMLFFAGLLCSAGGIGGGGVYVTLLMVVGKLRPRDAVPLSKAIVFLGSLASLTLNLRKTMAATPGAAEQKSIIDYSICRIVVPASLMGTLVGVLLNRIAADRVVVSALSITLGGMTFMVIRTFLKQRSAEELEDAAKASPEDAVELASGRGAPPSEAPSSPFAPPKRALGVCKKQDAVLAVGLLLTVILCGVLRAHASACAEEMHGVDHHEHRACHHPINMHFYRRHLEGWMRRPVFEHGIQHFLLWVPISICLAVMVHFSRVCIAEGWTVREIAVYSSMGVTTGCLAGLVGIGGGLIFSPFFLVMGVDPAVAVATSSTCVIFTSSSTTLQYLFTDRVITSLAGTYGLVNLLASWVGTSFVHYLQDNYNTRKSYITMIVAAGVFLSLVLSVVKLVEHPVMHHHHHHPASALHSINISALQFS